LRVIKIYLVSNQYLKLSETVRCEWAGKWASERRALATHCKLAHNCLFPNSPKIR